MLAQSSSWPLLIRALDRLLDERFKLFISFKDSAQAFELRGRYTELNEIKLLLQDVAKVKYLASKPNTLEESKDAGPGRRDSDGEFRRDFPY